MSGAREEKKTKQNKRREECGPRVLGGYNERCSASACSGLGGHDMLWRSVWPVSSVSTACHVDGRGQNEENGLRTPRPPRTAALWLGGLQEPGTSRCVWIRV